MGTTPIKLPPRPDEQPWGTCDWGFCDDEVVAWRWGDGLAEWLPVCRKHIEPRAARLHAVCDACGAGHPDMTPDEAAAFMAEHQRCTP